MATTGRDTVGTTKGICGAWGSVGLAASTVAIGPNGNGRWAKWVLYDWGQGTLVLERLRGATIVWGDGQGNLIVYEESQRRQKRINGEDLSERTAAFPFAGNPSGIGSYSIYGGLDMVRQGAKEFRASRSTKYPPVVAADGSIYFDGALFREDAWRKTESGRAMLDTTGRQVLDDRGLREIDPFLLPFGNTANSVHPLCGDRFGWLTGQSIFISPAGFRPAPAEDPQPPTPSRPRLDRLRCRYSPCPTPVRPDTKTIVSSPPNTSHD